MSEQPPISQDPEVLAEEKQNRIWHLKLERYKEMATAVSVILQTFKSEAVSLVSGVGTLVIGYFQVRKYVVQGRHDVKAVRSEGVTLGYGSGQGRLGRAHIHQIETPPPPPKRGDTSDLMPPPQQSSMFSGVLGFPDTGESIERLGFADPINYFQVLAIVVFIWSSLAAWAKRKKKIAASKEVL
jgi:hypothetical protein